MCLALLGVTIELESPNSTHVEMDIVSFESLECNWNWGVSLEDINIEMRNEKLHGSGGSCNRKQSLT